MDIVHPSFPGNSHGILTRITQPWLFVVAHLDDHTDPVTCDVLRMGRKEYHPVSSSSVGLPSSGNQLAIRLETPDYGGLKLECTDEDGSPVTFWVPNTLFDGCYLAQDEPSAVSRCDVSCSEPNDWCN